MHILVKDKLIDWLIEYGFYAISPIFQPYNGRPGKLLMIFHTYIHDAYWEEFKSNATSTVTMYLNFEGLIRRVPWLIDWLID